MSVYVDQTDFERAWHGGSLDESEWQRIDGLLRRAERELTLLVGDLSGYDGRLVADTLVDAVIESQMVDNPARFRSESDGDYTYTRMTLTNGSRSRFWWPRNLLELFGIHDSGRRLRVHRIGPSPAGRGWAW